MNSAEYIEFKKQRELGDIVSDTFAFMRTQFKPFFGAFFKIVGPFLAVMVIALALYLYYVGDQFNLMITSDIPNFENALLIFGLALFYFISLLLVYTVSQSTVLHYIKSYTIGHGKVDVTTIRKEVYASLLSFIGLAFLVAASLIVGMIVCCLPAVYLWVPLSLTFSIMVFAKKGAFDAYSDSFILVKDNWWITFATLFVIAIIVAVASWAFSIPATIYTYLKMGIFSGEVDAETMMDYFKDPIYIIFNILSSIAQFMLNIISLVAGVFVYFNLNEQKNFTGTFERIQNLGNTPEN